MTAPIPSHPETDFDSFAAYGNYAAEVEADLSWNTRELLESICASVESVSDDFTLDTMDILD